MSEWAWVTPWQRNPSTLETIREVHCIHARLRIVASQYGRVGTLSNQFGELLVAAGVPDAVVMALVGHESAAMSHRYTHVGKEALSRAAKSLPEI
jgi:hypothetical protein